MLKPLLVRARDDREYKDVEDKLRFLKEMQAKVENWSKDLKTTLENSYNALKKFKLDQETEDRLQQEKITKQENEDVDFLNAFQEKTS